MMLNRIACTARPYLGKETLSSLGQVHLSFQSRWGSAGFYIFMSKSWITLYDRIFNVIIMSLKIFPFSRVRQRILSSYHLSLLYFRLSYYTLFLFYSSSIRMIFILFYTISFLVYLLVNTMTHVWLVDIRFCTAME